MSDSESQILDLRFQMHDPRTWRTVLAAIMIGMSATVLAQSRPASPGAEAPSSRPVSRDEALWEEIAELDREPGRAEATPAGDDAALQRRKTLLEKVRHYLTAYPGGPRRDEAVRVELRALFEIGTLSGGAYRPLRERVEEYLRHPSGEGAQYEAAWWAIRCRRLAPGAAASPPSSSAPVGRYDNELLDAYREYVRRYPRSPYVPRMAAELYEAAGDRGDRDEQRRMVAQLRRDFTEHVVTLLLTARLERSEAVGRPFSLAFDTADGRIDTAEWRGRPVLIVVWAGFSEGSRACAAEVEAFRREHGELRVVGVNLDESEEQMNVACSKLGLAWPQFNDGMGRANRFALKWGVRAVPWVFVLDRQGRLVGSSGAGGWRRLAGSVLEN